MRICAAEVAAESLDWFDQFRPFHTKEGIDALVYSDQHYKLIAYLSKQLPVGSHVWDVGSAFGASAVALAQGPVHITSFDPIPQVHEPIKEANPQIRWSAMDLIRVPAFKWGRPPRLIVLDVDPHDGVWENDLLECLREHCFTGFLIMDDIYLNSAMMKLWTEIPERKYDLTHMGHHTGTGLVCFNDEPVEIC